MKNKILVVYDDPAEGSTKIATKVKDYIIKSDWKIEDVVNLVKKRLG